MDKNLQTWIESNKLDIISHQTKDNTFLIETEEKNYHFTLLKEVEGRIFDEEFNLIVGEPSGDYYVFNFGGQYYFTSILDIKKPKLVPFKYIGKVKQELELPFTHLGIHGKYELLNGSRDYFDWCAKAKFYGYDSLGICEKNSLAGIIHFQKACEKVDIKPIFGETVTVKDFANLKLYVLNEKGWKNLLKINKEINIINERYIEEKELLKYGEGLAIIFINEVALSNELIRKYQPKFDQVYFQIDTVQWSNEKTDLKYLKNIKQYLTKYANILEPILINDSYYLDKEDAHIKKLLNKIGGIGHQKDSKDQYFKNLDDSFHILDKLFKEGDKRFFNLFEKAVANTVKLSESSNYKIPLDTFHLPNFSMKGLPEIYQKETNEELFWYIIEEGMEEILENKKIKPEEVDLYYDRVEMEVELIKKGGYIDYFLIWWEIINWAKSQEILVGPGRGSAVGCLVSYLLDITKLDPIKYDLLFERFLNEGRIGKTLPDIDTDFAANRRKEVVGYIENKYGKDFVCNVGTHTTLKIKSGLKDLVKIKFGGSKYKEVNYLTKSMYFKENKEGNWEELFIAAQKNSSVKNFIKENPHLINDLLLLMKQPKAASIHPCATIILPKYKNETLYNHIPLKLHDGLLVSEWEGPELEEAGYLKEDILGLHQLDKIKFILDQIKEEKGEEIDIYNLPIDDQKVMQLFREGKNGDIFQFGSEGLTAYCKEVKPDGLEELIAMVSLYRPGPIGSGAHHSYVNLKLGRKEPEYDFGLEEVTKSTYGLIVYQEQMMKAFEILGGFSPSETDDARKATGKKIESVLVAYKKRFIENAVKKGCLENEAKKIWTKLEVFSAYGFNRSHAAAYSLLGYISQWLKCYYPLQFWTAALQFVEEEGDLLRYMSEIKQDDTIKIVPPDINESDIDFTTDVDKNVIFWSISKIKFLGEVGLKAILEEREANGKFYSIEEFYKRLPKGEVNKRIITNLILSGAFDIVEEVGTNILKRSELVRKFYKIANLNEDMLLHDDDAKKEWWLLLKQKELSGLGDINFKALIKQNEILKNISVRYIEGYQLEDQREDAKVSFGGIIKKVNLRSGIKAGKFATLILDCNNTEVQVFFWNPEYEEYQTILNKPGIENNILISTGVVRRDKQKGTNRIDIYKKDESIFMIGKTLEELTKETIKKTYNLGDVIAYKDGDYEVVDFYENGSPKMKKVTT